MKSNYFKQGNQLLRENKLDEAITAYKEAIKQNPNIYVYYQNLGEAFAKQGKLDEAIINYRCAIELNSNSAYSYNILGDLLTLQGAFSEATNTYKIANKIIPSFSIFQDNLNKSLLRLESKKNVKTSKKIASKIIKLSDNETKSYQSYLCLGDDLQRKGQVDRAIISYLKSIKVKPESYVGYYRLGDLLLYKKTYFSKESLTEIIQVCQDSIEKVNNIKNEVYLLIARCFAKLGKMEMAQKYCQKGVYNKILNTKPSYINNHWDSGKLKGPNFALIGAPKCGTTTLYYYLTQHPQILEAITKEPKYFDCCKSQISKDYYYAHFPPTPEDKTFIVGDASPSYFYSIYNQLNTSEYMYSLLPNIKLIIILRNPVDRAVSQYYHWHKLGLETNSLESVVESEIKQLQRISELTFEIYSTSKHHYIANSLYFFFLKHWLKTFSRNQVLILKTEDLARSPSIIMNQIFEFLEIGGYSIEWNERHNVGSYDEISSDIRCKLSSFFKPYNSQLEEYIGGKFNWS